MTARSLTSTLTERERDSSDLAGEDRGPRLRTPEGHSDPAQDATPLPTTPSRARYLRAPGWPALRGSRPPPCLLGPQPPPLPRRRSTSAAILSKCNPVTETPPALPAGRSVRDSASEEEAPPFCTSCSARRVLGLPAWLLARIAGQRGTRGTRDCVFQFWRNAF